MKHIIAIIMLFSFIITLAACSSDPGKYIPESQKPAQRQSPLLKVESSLADNTSKLGDRINVTCANKNECPEFVGSLVSYTEKSSEYSINFCSFTLISDNRVITNEHCLSKQILNSTDCTNTYALFPETNISNKLKVKCKKIIAHSGLNHLKNRSRPDWAILELEHTINRSYAKPDINGVHNLTSAEIYPTFYSKNTKSDKFSHNGVIKKRVCKTNMAGRLAQIYNHPSSPVVSLGCEKELETGNSGAGVISNNKLIAVFSHFAKKNDFYIMGNKVTVNKRAISGSNPHCIKELNRGELSKYCEFNQNRNNQFDYNYSLIYSTYIDNSVQRSYDSIKNSDPSISWNAYDNTFLSKFNINITKDYLTTPVAIDFLQDIYYQKKFPYYPNCISKDRKTEKDFLLLIPYLYSNLSNIKIANGTGYYQTPMTQKSLGYKVNYDSINGNYRAHIIKLNDIEEINKYISLKNQATEEYNNCLNSKETCLALHEANYEVDQFIANNKYDKYYFYNNDFINLNEIELTAPVFIKVCQE